MHVLNRTKMHFYGQALAVSALALSNGTLITIYLLVVLPFRFYIDNIIDLPYKTSHLNEEVNCT